MRGARGGRRRKEGGRCSPMVLLGVEPVALREFHTRLLGNTLALFTLATTERHDCKCLRSRVTHICLVCHDASAAGVYPSLRKGDECRR